MGDEAGNATEVFLPHGRASPQLRLATSFSTVIESSRRRRNQSSAQVLANCPRCFAAAETGDERRWTRVLTALKIQQSAGSDLAISRNRHRFLASLAPPLVVAIIVASGLLWLAFVNPRGGAEPQTRFEHAAAIQRLFFRDSR